MLVSCLFQKISVLLGTAGRYNMILSTSSSLLQLAVPPSVAVIEEQIRSVYNPSVSKIFPSRQAVDQQRCNSHRLLFSLLFNFSNLSNQAQTFQVMKSLSSVLASKHLSPDSEIYTLHFRLEGSAPVKEQWVGPCWPCATCQLYGKCEII